MKISELFYSIQGEGKQMGVPSFFIRTNYCNLRCRFDNGNLCDTNYTSWSPEDKKNIGEMSIYDIMNEYKKYNCKDVVITGGEPTMQEEELTNLCRELKKYDTYITLETNGTSIGDYANNIDLVSISPKLSNSIPHGTTFEKSHIEERINIPVLKKYNDGFINGKYDIQWKFVIGGEKDIPEIIELEKKIGFKRSEVYLMPEGITREDIQSKREVIIEICKKYKYNYTDRLHILVWGNKRCV